MSAPILVHLVAGGDTHLRADVAHDHGIRPGDRITDRQWQEAAYESYRRNREERRARQ